MFTFIPLASTYIFGTLLTANGDMKTLNWISVLGLLVNVGLNYVLIPDIGIKGAAIATLVTQIVVVLLQLIYIGWQFKTAPRWQLIASLVVFSTGLYFLGFFMLGIGIDHKVQFILLCGIGVLWAVITGMVNIKAIYRILKLGD
jgi:O-antigen/teichoic acid export membrane protein